MRKLLEILLLNTFALASPAANYLTACPEPVGKREIRDYIPELPPKAMKQIRGIKPVYEISAEEIRYAMKLLNLKDPKDLVFIKSGAERPYITTKEIAESFPISASLLAGTVIIVKTPEGYATVGEIKKDPKSIMNVAKESDTDGNYVITPEECARLVEELARKALLDSIRTNPFFFQKNQNQ